VTVTTPRGALQAGSAVVLALALLLALCPQLIDRPSPAPAGPDELVLGWSHLPPRGQVIDHSPLPLGLYTDPEGFLIALSLRCPYLGCRLAWDEVSEVFACPCHGDRFGADGHWLAGEGSSHLHRHPIKQGPSGTVEVDLSEVILMIGREIPPDVQYPTSRLKLHM
jgi:nitrite reductase/ring-hydroxylating ferredoxin subunit